MKHGQAAIDEANSASTDINKEMNSGDGTIVKPAKIAGRLAESGLRQVGNVAGQVGDFFGSFIQPAIEKLGNDIGGSKAVQDFANGKAGNAITDNVSKASQAYQSWSQQHPDAAKNLEAAFNTAGLVVGEKPAEQAVQATTDATKQAAGAIGDAAGGVVEKVGNVMKTRASNADTAALADNLNKIQDTISPKLTAKETKLAMDQGRLIEGQDPTLLKNGTPDTVLPSDRVVKASQTINRNIPNAAKMKPSELYAALDGKISDTATKLQPEMQAIPLTPATKAKLTSDWTALKTKQLADPYISNNVNLPKLQANFENNFLNKTGVRNMNDYWETAKAYDASVPANVKSATSMSSEGLQDQKSVWLQNRAVLRNAINDAANGLGKTSKQAFSDMHDMYDAQTNLLSKAKVGTGESSKIVQWIKDNPVKAKVIGGAAGTVGLGGAAAVITHH